MWTEFVLEASLGWPFWRETRGKAVRVHRLHGWRPDDVNVRGTQSLEVSREAAWITCEVFMRRKLRGIDKDRNDNPFGPPSRLLDERHVAAMQRAHRGYQRDAGARLSIRFHCAAERWDRPENFQSCCHNFRPYWRSVAKPQCVQQG